MNLLKSLFHKVAQKQNKTEKKNLKNRKPDNQKGAKYTKKRSQIGKGEKKTSERERERKSERER